MPQLRISDIVHSRGGRGWNGGMRRERERMGRRRGERYSGGGAISPSYTCQARES